MQKRGPQTFYVNATIHTSVPIERPLNEDGTPKKTKVTVSSPYNEASSALEPEFKTVLDQNLQIFESKLSEENCPDLESQMKGARRFAEQILSAAVANLSKSIIIE